MLNKIKALFGFGPAPEVQNQSAPYKVPEPEATKPIPLVVEVAPMPVGIEAVVATPVAKAPKVAKPKAPAKPKAEKAPKVAAMKVLAVKKPRVPKAK